MTLTLHLGVNEVPYADKAGTTTGDVAEILEAKYHPMELFFEIHQRDVVAALEDGLVGAFENMLMGAPVSQNPFGEGEAKIEQDFKTFLDMGEMEALGYPGVPTEAALKGVNHRLKHPYAKANSRRPSLVDTGAYQQNFRAWVEAD